VSIGAFVNALVWGWVPADQLSRPIAVPARVPLTCGELGFFVVDCVDALTVLKTLILAREKSIIRMFSLFHSTRLSISRP
jgi:hypothetical protein